jgi:hypothetical protein
MVVQQSLCELDHGLNVGGHYGGKKPALLSFKKKTGGTNGRRPTITREN